MMRDTPPPHWRQLYEAALFETNPGELLRRVKAAEHAILDRVQEVTNSGDNFEREVLSSALNAMRDLRRMYERSPF